jgi:hypothetical protein
MALFIALISAACATNSPRSSASPDAAAGQSESDVLGGSDLRHFAQGQTIMTAVQQLRPSFLVGRGRTPVVSIDGSPATSLDVLRTILVADVRAVRLMRGAFGSGLPAILSDGRVAVGDVILVYTRTQ